MLTTHPAIGRDYEIRCATVESVPVGAMPEESRRGGGGRNPSAGAPYPTLRFACLSVTGAALIFGQSDPQRRKPFRAIPSLGYSASDLLRQNNFKRLCTATLFGSTLRAPAPTH